MADEAPPGSARKVPAHAEPHRIGEAEWLEEAVFGSLDGVITALALVVTVSAVLSEPAHSVFLTVIGAAVAGTMSMFVGAYLSSRSHENLVARERAREEWEVDHVPEIERAEVEEIYHRQGFTDAEVAILVNRLTSDKKRWVDMMMRDELGLEAEPPERSFRHAGVIGGSYLVGGAIPALPFLDTGNARIGWFFGHPVPATLVISLTLGAVVLAAVGLVDAGFSGRSRWRSLVDMLAIGFATAIAVFVVTTVLSPA